jgi:hypothetical protein
VTIDREGTALRAFAHPTESALNPFLQLTKIAFLRIFSEVSDRFSALVASHVDGVAIQCFTATTPLLR